MLIRKSFGLALVFVAAASFASGQDTKVETREFSDATDVGSPSAGSEQEIWLYLVGGRQMKVDEAFENADGIWFKVGNVTTLIDRKRVERVERKSNTKQELIAEPLRGSGSWSISESARVEKFYLNKFGRRLPLTALGQSDVHTRWGYDHRQGMDIGLHPDSREGRALIEFLRSEDIPFLTFREAVPGVATGPHIHVGIPSRRRPVH